MGLLDYISNIKFEPNPVGMGLLGMGAQMMNASTNQNAPIGFGNIAGGALNGFNQGLQGYQAAQENADALEQRKMLRDIQNRQLELQNKKYADEIAKQDALKGIDFTQFQNNPVGLSNALVKAGFGDKALDIYNTSTIKANEAEKARQARLDQIMLAASLRPPSQPRQDPLVQVQTENGAMYVPSSQASGMTPFNASLAKKTQMPPKALDLQNEELDQISTAGNTSSDLDALLSKMQNKNLEFGLLSNAQNKARNFFGNSTEQSRNYSDAMATLEKMRNDSLRLNKGVQTEGDAQRAWNELMNNLNDNEVVRHRLNEIKGYNDRAVALHQLKLDSIRSQYGLDPLDITPYISQGSPLSESKKSSGSSSTGNALVDHYLGNGGK